MADWKRINAARCRQGEFRSEDSDGFNGLFLFKLNGLDVAVIVSDGEGWKHVSVSLRSKNIPSWSIMCQVKDIFFEPEEAVMQLHPPHSTYINNHPGVLHLWQPTEERIPLPPPILVGIKELGDLSNRRDEARAIYRALNTTE